MEKLKDRLCLPEDYLGYDRYSYCRGNPFKFTDPSGEYFEGDNSGSMGSIMGAMLAAGEALQDEMMLEMFHAAMDLAQESLDARLDALGVKKDPDSGSSGGDNNGNASDDNMDSGAGNGGGEDSDSDDGTQEVDGAAPQAGETGVKKPEDMTPDERQEYDERLANAKQNSYKEVETHNHTGDDMYFKPEGNLIYEGQLYYQNGAYKLGPRESIWMPIDGLVINGKLYKVNDNYTYLNVCLNGQIYPHYESRLDILKWRARGISLFFLDGTWDNLKKTKGL